ncbi:hypothetical protein KAFR_0F03800 [Kazachstania africana CBS 2517]|uniref:DNA/RNA-binding protein Alba-like domain-containing protein n=1 Tax=Kazachstania africana (strain ATCC 22294 / BCRC 22015 / CBS 2517 / CECT 1963 / NBRC 1671 / NRRL Y-8276) TaxID=1071382 RepID=H2AX76_KAZAF|nr:hypothetical protein KAFR_0F03800 [Kazachstania africana CBS 2517]CCF58976.1 hypothetical protein KAFR_0F03800 [Kazachstania africana CBS 2517]
MSKKIVIYNGAETSLDLSSISETLTFIEQVVIPNIFQNDQENLLRSVKFLKVSKNDSIKSSVDKLQSFTFHKDTVCLYSYGPHIQKLLSIVEIAKSTIDTNCKQWNKLTNFELSQEGRNELLEKRTIVPILIAFLTISEEFNYDFFKNELNGFTKQY